MFRFSAQNFEISFVLPDVWNGRTHIGSRADYTSRRIGEYTIWKVRASRKIIDKIMPQSPISIIATSFMGYLEKYAEQDIDELSAHQAMEDGNRCVEKRKNTTIPFI
jgi:hypothetical protein